MKRPQMAVVQSTHKTSNFNLYKADLHGAIVGCNLLTTCFRHEKSFRILKHVLKPADNRALKSVVSVWWGGCIRQNRTVSNRSLGSHKCLPNHPLTSGHNFYLQTSYKLGQLWSYNIQIDQASSMRVHRYVLFLQAVEFDSLIFQGYKNISW